MASLSSIKPPIKALVLADSGMGKTGMLWSLAVAGFKIKLYDADNGHGVLVAALKDHPAAKDNIEVNVFADKMKINAQGFPSGKPKAWSEFLGALDRWPDSVVKDAAGKVTESQSIYDWGTDVVVAIDSLSFLGRHALQKAMDLENKTGKLPELQHYNTAMVQIEGVLANLYSDDVRCHVIIMTHIDYISNDMGAMFGLPMSIGKALSPKVPRYFNTMLALKRSGKKTVLSTKPTAMVQTKVEAFDAVKDEYTLIEDGKGKPGLSEFFADAGWSGPDV